MVVTAPGTRPRPTFPLNGPARRDDAAASSAFIGEAGAFEGVVHGCSAASAASPLQAVRAAACYFVAGSAGTGVGAVAGADVGAGDGPAAHGPNVARSLSSVSSRAFSKHGFH